MSTDGLNSPGALGPVSVLLNVYDVAQGDSKSTVVRLNNLVGPTGLGLGGVFHGAIVLGTVEFSFGFCERGTGVYAVKAGQNPMYTFRETVDLGVTDKSMHDIRSIIQELKQEWPGASYDLLHRNCCHFCVDLAARLGVGPVPGWLNRFASGAAATITITQDTVKTVQDFGAEVGRFWNKTIAAASQQQQQLAEKLQQQQQSWAGQQAAQQQQRSSSETSAPRGSPAAGGVSQAGQQLWSGLAQAGQQLKATTAKLAQAAAAKTSSSAPRLGSLALSSMSLNSNAAGQQYAAPGPQQQQGGMQQDVFQQPQQQQPSSGATGPQEAATSSSVPISSAEPGLVHSSSGLSDKAAALLGAQPKLSKQYRLGSSSGHHAVEGADTAGAAAGSSGGFADAASGGSGLQSSVSEGSLMPFLSVDAVDPFVALVGEDDAEDDAQQQAAVESAVHHTPTPPVRT